MKLAFQAAVPFALWDDPIDCLHRVIKPMVEQMRAQLRDQGFSDDLRISIMVDTPEPKHKDLKHAVHAALRDRTATDIN